MDKFKRNSIAALTIAILYAFPSPANATCTDINWTNTNVFHPVSQVKGRLCGKNLLIRASGRGKAMGWTRATLISPNAYVGSFAYGQAINRFKLTIHRRKKTMNVRVSSKFEDGTRKVWFARFKPL